jgi:serine/threonine-protein kinase
MDPTQLQPGYRLDRYELLCPLAYGGMASVWLARFGGRLGFERMVVIKMILPQYSQDPRFQEMFLDEARIASRIEHSNVARILDVGEHQENYFIVMEWVDGDSLSKILRAVDQRKQRVPAGVALRIIADAAAGLHAAHELRERDGTPLHVVHRDVSPQNILIANNGTTVIIDFGVAKARDRVSQDTSAGQLKGKIRYMAPEQALGHAIDHRADVWALGAMLYELFTGNPPYDGPNEVATLHKLTGGQPPPPMAQSIPEAIRAVVERALGYDPENRFATALEMNLALEGAMVEIGEPTTAAIVSHYTGQLLADRKAARKRAVDIALDNAKKRDNGQPVSGLMPISPTSTGVAPIPFPSSRPMLPVNRSESPSAPSDASGQSLNETPSAASSATFGSANMEYLPSPILDGGSRRRSYFAAAALGASVAAGVIGAILIVTTVVKNDKPTSKTANEPPAAAIAPPVTTAAAATTPDTAAPTEPPPAADTATATTPTPKPSAATTPTTGKPPTAATHSDPPARVATNPVPTHKPPPVPASTGKTSKPASSPVDRGF